jgi:UDP-N-acetyl-D-mannosaminouronate:lipid I N-acetyl-D-mannosaminouronosyltransferase
MSASTRPGTLHERAREAFSSRTIRGFKTFAPPSEAKLLELVGTGDGILVAVNAEKLARADPALQAIANANLAYPDGMGAVLALRRLGIASRRIAGADLWLRLVGRYATERRFFLIGAKRPVIEAVAQTLRNRHPGIELDYRDGYLKPGDTERLYDEFRRVRPQIVLVGMGSPQQEILMNRLFAVHPALYMGLGGSFDVLVGRKPRAPDVIQSVGLEWAYQLVRDPRRLRRAPALLKFAVLLAADRLQ